MAEARVTVKWRREQGSVRDVLTHGPRLEVRIVRGRITRHGALVELEILGRSEDIRGFLEALQGRVSIAKEALAGKT